MNTENIGYSEENAVNFIRQFVGENISKKYTDDEILTICDIIWDYYEEKGLLSLNDFETEDELLNPDALTDFVKKQVRANDQLLMDNDDVEKIVNAELQYEESLEKLF